MAGTYRGLSTPPAIHLSFTHHVELRHFFYSWPQTFVQLAICVRLLIGDEQVKTQAESAPGSELEGNLLFIYIFPGIESS